MRVHLGDRVRDKITGLQGIAIARTEWLHGCIRITIQPEAMKDGKALDSYVIDEPQCELVARAAVPNVTHWREPEAETESVVTAGPRPVATRPAEPQQP